MSKSHRTTSSLKSVSGFRRHLPGLIIAAVGMVLYLNTLHHGFVLDDITIVSQNHLVQEGIKGIPEILKTSYWFGYNGSTDLGYRPLSLVMFAVEWQISPDNAHFNHLVNILLYGATGFLLFVTLRRLFANYSILIPFAAALLFISHPVHTEVVANIKSRDEMLSFFFSIGVIYFLTGYMKNASFKRLLPSLACFFLALVSKENAVTIVAIVPLVIYYFSDVSPKKNIMTTAAFLALIVAYIALRFALPEGFTFRKEMPVPDNTLLAAPDMMSRLATAVNILGRYLLVLVFPYTLISDYSYSHIPIVNWSDWGALASLIVHLFLISYTVVMIRKKDLLAFGIAFYFVTFSIVSNVFFPVGATLAERFLYMPSLGFCLVIAVLIAKLLKVVTTKDLSDDLFLQVRKNVKYVSVVSGIFFLYSFKTIDRNYYWKDNLALFSSDIKSAPNSCKLNYYYAVSLLDNVNSASSSGSIDRGTKIKMAIDALEKALSVTKNFVEVYEELGYAYYLEGYFEKAKETYELAIHKGSHSSALFNNYGVVCFESNEYDKAINLLDKAVKQNPNNSETYNNIGSVYNKEGMYAEAIPYLEKAIELKPRYVVAYKNIARSYANVKEYDMAISNLKKAMELTPDDPDIYLYIGLSYKYKGDLITAKTYFDQSDILKTKGPK